MNFPLDISSSWLWTANIIYFLFLLAALFFAQWQHLKNPQDANVLFGASILLWMAWRMGGGLNQDVGLEFHLLLATSITLMFGWAYAILCVSVAQLVLTLEGQAAGLSYGMNVLCNGIVPIWITYFAIRIMDRWLPPHFFIYIYAGAFFTGALAMFASRVLGMWVLWGAGVHSYQHLMQDYAPILPIMMFPEAFINGSIMTLLVVFRPQWVSSFSDERYLRNK